MVDSKLNGQQIPAPATLDTPSSAVRMEPAIVETAPQSPPPAEPVVEMVAVAAAPPAGSPMLPAPPASLLDAVAGRNLLERAIEFTEQRDAVLLQAEGTSLPAPPPAPEEAENLLAEDSGLGIAPHVRDVWPEIVIEFGEARQALEARKAASDPVREAAETTMRRTGLQEAHLFDGEVSAGKSFRGLVALVGINDFDRLRQSREFRQSDVDRLIESLVGTKNVAYRGRNDEFVLLFEGVSGEPARRKSSELSERLWDFQLRHIGSMTIAFSWGAFEATGEPLGVCLENARDEMQNTRRGRRSTAQGQMLAGRKAVNL